MKLISFTCVDDEYDLRTGVVQKYSSECTWYAMVAQFNHFLSSMGYSSPYNEFVGEVEHETESTGIFKPSF